MNERLRFAVVGTRAWAEGFHLPGLTACEQVAVTAVCGRDRGRAELVARKFSVPHVYTDWRELLSREPLDGLSIAVPNVLHHPIALAALDAGLHVICEKPLSTDASLAHEMLERATVRKRQHLTMFDYRAVPAVRRAQELIHEGFLGRVLHVTGAYYHSSLLDRSRPVTWRMRRAEAGAGTLADLGSHVIDLVRLLAGEFGRVSAQLATFTPERPDPTTGLPAAVETDDAAALVAEMANGAQALLHASKVAKGRANYLQLALYGEEGALLIDGELGQSWVGALRGARRGEKTFTSLEVPARLTAGFDSPDSSRSLVSAFRFMTEPFFAAIRAGGSEDVPSNFADGLAVQRVLDAAARSAETWRWEQVLA